MKNTIGIKLGDHITRGNIDKYGFLVNKNKPCKDYRVIGLNPNLKLLEVFTVKGYEESGKEETFDWSISDKLRPQFPEGHLVHLLMDRDWSHCCVGNF